MRGFQLRLAAALCQRRLQAAGAAVAFGTVVSSMRTDQQQSQLLTQAAHSESATAPAAPAEPKPMACLHLSLGAVAKAEVLGRFPAVHSRVLAERVLLRPCLIEEKSEMRVRVLAYAQSNQSQSLLVAMDEPLWEEGEILFMGLGYPVLPISFAEPPRLPPTADVAGPAGQARAAQPAAAAVAAADPAVAIVETTPWDVVEGLWRRLEAAGVLVVDRNAEAMPNCASLASGSEVWVGDLPADKNLPDERAVVTLLDGGRGEIWTLQASSAAPECGFCKFMKAGPCGEQFKAWEACIDKARDSDADFVDFCGAQTLQLKECTDLNPEYYGLLSGSDEE